MEERYAELFRVARALLDAGITEEAEIIPTLVFEGLVDWRYGLPMGVGGLVGGYLGGLVSHRANRTVIRWLVIGIGFGVAAYYFWRLYGPHVTYVGGE